MKLASLLKESQRMQDRAGVHSSKDKAIQTGSPLDGGEGYDPYQIEVDIDTFRIIQGQNIIEISRKASKELAKEIRNSFF
jgi:hypothetical protein